MSSDAASSRETTHSAPGSNQDYDFFYAGLERETLLVQQCAGCGVMRNPPSPLCCECGSFDWSPRALSGRGTVFSYLIHHHPPLPTFPVPHGVVLADLDEGIRFVGALRDEDRERVAIDAPVRVDFLRRNGVATFQFALDEARLR